MCWLLKVVKVIRVSEITQLHSDVDVVRRKFPKYSGSYLISRNLGIDGGCRCFQDFAKGFCKTVYTQKFISNKVGYGVQVDFAEM